MSDKSDSKRHVKTIKDLFDIFEPYLTAEDIQEIIEDLTNTKEVNRNEQRTMV